MGDLEGWSIPMIWLDALERPTATDSVRQPPSQARRETELFNQQKSLCVLS